MISKEKYVELREALEKGANLPMCDLGKMAEFENANNLNTQEGDILIHCPIENLQCMPIPPSR